DAAARDEIARHGGGVIIDAHVDRRHAAPGARHHRPIGGNIDERGEDPAVGVAAGRGDGPLPAPPRLSLHPVVLDLEHFYAEPLVKRTAPHKLLDFFRSHLFAVRHGATTTLPITSRSRIRRSPSAACSSGSTFSISGRILPCAIMSISAVRF